MNEYYNIFIKYLEEENKEKCVSLALSWLSGGQIDIHTLYDGILRPSLNNIDCGAGSRHLCIWKEHIQSSIVKTIIECCYPYVVKERESKSDKASGGRVVILCPDGENHDIGARMVSDYFTMCGYDSVFVGGSTPKEEFLKVINALKPKYIAISVTNYYNLVAAKGTIQSIRSVSAGGFKILVGGSAFKSNPGAFREIGADVLIDTYDDIRNLS